MSDKKALLVIDVQANMFDPANAVDGADALLGRVQGLIAKARAAKAPVVFVRNCGDAEVGDPDVKGTPGWELHPSLGPQPGELVLDKTTCNVFDSTPLGEELAKRGIKGVVVAGLQSDWCIRESSLGALDRGLEVTLVEDAHSTYDGKTRTAAEARAAINDELREASATLERAESVRFE
jgi:nicotinamidase-related amidase